jgi:hypothetical protein
MSALLAPHVQRQDTTYRKAILVRVRVAYAMHKLVQGASLLMCSEQFAIGKSTVSGVVRMLSMPF